VIPEAGFLLALARGRWGPRPGAVRSRRVLELSEYHQVAALCGWNLDHEVPPDERAAIEREWPELARGLRLAFRRHLVRNATIFEEVRQLGTRFESAGLGALVLKGPWLAYAAYPHRGTRPIGDLDLCVRPADYTRTLAALGGMGYRACAPAPPDGEAALRQSHFKGQVRLVAPHRTMIELHLRLVNLGLPSDDEDWVWHSARSIADWGMRTPSPEAMLLHLLLHANQHAYAVLRLLEDIRWALLRDGPTLNWELLLGRIGAIRARRSCYHSLLLARELVGAEVPEGPLLRLRPGHVARSVFDVMWNLKAVRRLEAPRPAQELEAPKMALLEIGSSRDKLRYLSALVAEAGGWVPAFRRLIAILKQPRERAGRG
jgi:putative nucleotidyltransferase-like protein